MTELDRTAEVIRDCAMAAVTPFTVDPQVRHAVAVPPGGDVKIIETDDSRLDNPRRSTGTYRPDDVDSFVAYVKEHYDTDATTVWIDRLDRQVVALLNDHGSGGPGWGDHRAVLTLKHSPEWKRWASGDSKLGTQEEFAERIEDGVLDIIEPAHADMLEIAQTIMGTTTASFRSAQRLDNGQVAVKWEENVEAKAGTKGDLEIPQVFKLALAPFWGEDRIELTARLRYRIASGQLKIGYKLDRPEEVVFACLQAIAERLQESFAQVYIGKPRS